MVKKIAEQHHGVLIMEDAPKTAQSQNEKSPPTEHTGALFRITLPLKDPGQLKDQSPSKTTRKKNDANDQLMTERQNSG